MAKNTATENTSAIDFVPPVIEASSSRSVMLTVKGTDGSDKQISRQDYIAARWSAGVSRAQIADELTQLQGKKIAYQVVFAATKDKPGGPAKKTKPAEATTQE